MKILNPFGTYRTHWSEVAEFEVNHDSLLDQVGLVTRDGPIVKSQALTQRSPFVAFGQLELEDIVEILNRTLAEQLHGD